jgi:hypothetical protein
MELLIAETEIVGKEEMAPMKFDWWPEATWRWWVEKKGWQRRRLVDLGSRYQVERNVLP